MNQLNTQPLPARLQRKLEDPPMSGSARKWLYFSACGLLKRLPADQAETILRNAANTSFFPIPEAEIVEALNNAGRNARGEFIPKKGRAGI